MRGLMSAACNDVYDCESKSLVDSQVDQGCHRLPAVSLADIDQHASLAKCRHHQPIAGGKRADSRWNTHKGQWCALALGV